MQINTLLNQHRVNIFKILCDTGFDKAKVCKSLDGDENKLAVIVYEPSNRNIQASEFRMACLKVELEKMLNRKIDIRNINRIDRTLLTTLHVEQTFELGLSNLRAYFVRNTHPVWSNQNQENSKGKQEVFDSYEPAIPHP